MIAVTSGLVSVVLAIAVNLATGGTASGWLQDVQQYAWPAVGLCAAVIIALGVVEIRIEAGKRSPSPMQLGAGQQYRRLPSPPHAFAGRKREFRSLVGRLKVSDAPLGPRLDIAGKPGVGKTALAVVVANEVGDRYRDAQLFLDLGGMKAHPLREGEVVARLLDQLGVPAEEISFDEKEMTDRLRARLSDLRAIIILDDAGSTEQVRPVIAAAGASALIVTSRKPLTELVELELIMLECMSEQESVALLEAVVGDRITRETRPARELAALCGYLPLALRIAGARLAIRPGLSVAALVAELRDEHARLDLLQVGDLEVRGSFNLSYNDFSDMQKAVFRRSSAIPSPTFDSTVAAAAAEVAVVQAKSALDELVRLQLLDVEEGGRFMFHDLLRLFAGEKLEQEEGRTAPIEAARRSTQSYIAELERVAAIIDPEDLTQVSQHEMAAGVSVTARSAEVDALDWLLDEKENIVSSMNVARQMQFDHELVGLGAAIRPFGLSGFPLRELVNLEDSAVLAARRLGDDAQLARVLFNLGRSYRHRGHGVDALRYLQESLRLARRAGLEPLVANLQYFIGHAQRENGQPKEASQSYRAALARFTAVGWAAKAAAVMMNLGLVEDNLGDLAAAELLLRQANERFAVIELNSVVDRRERAWCHQALGGVLMRQGRLDDAVEYLSTALGMFEALHDRQGQIYSQRDLGDVAARRGNLADAVAHFELAAEISRELGEDRGYAQALASLAITEGRRGQLVGVVRHFLMYCRTFLALRDRGRFGTVASLAGYCILAALRFRVAPRFPRSRRS